MTLLRLNIDGDAIEPVDTTAPLGVALAESLRQSPDGPVIVLIHGKTFSSKSKSNCPHRNILSLDTSTKSKITKSWPRRLGFGTGDPKEGLCIALGWESRCNLRAAYRAAGVAGAALGHLSGLLADLSPERPFHVVAHSLGARVYLSSLAHGPALSGRSILVAGAELRDKAEEAVSLPSAKHREIINVTSRENDIFDFLLERGIRPFDFKSTALGGGLVTQSCRWLDIQIDNPRTKSELKLLGFRIADPIQRICHHSGYSRPGVFKFYKALLRSPDELPFDLLAQSFSHSLEPRWSRLFHVQNARLALPFLKKV